MLRVHTTMKTPVSSLVQSNTNRLQQTLLQEYDAPFLLRIIGGQNNKRLTVESIPCKAECTSF